MKKPELLSPAGNRECLIAAIQGGCDAVYLGGYAFGARSFAGNFSNEELIEAISYAHIYGVKVYVTVNTLVYEDEVEQFMSYIDFLHRNAVDAVIIQDIGMLDLVRSTFPNLEVHASTQMHIHNLEGVQLLETLGVKRAVMARETDWQHLRAIKQNTSLELEVFVHGALCICYSGQCLMSSMIGGRSGNRGTCTQCCRMLYQLEDHAPSYVLSPKDLNSLENIGTLMEIGIDSLKIEGRMKRAEYVYYVTHLYRKVIDEYAEKQTITIEKEEIQILKKLFNREFTKGFLFFEQPKQLMNHNRPNHMGVLVGKVTSYQNNMVTCLLTDTVRQGDGIRILNQDKDYGCTLNKIYKQGKLVKSGDIGESISFRCDFVVKIGDQLVKTSDQQDLEKIQEMIRAASRKVSIQGKIVGKIGKPLRFIVTDTVNTVEVSGNILIEQAKTREVSSEQIQKQLSKMGGTPYQLNDLEFELDKHLFIPIQELNIVRRMALEALSKKRQYTSDYKRQVYIKEVPEVLEEIGYTVQIESFKQYQSIQDQTWKQIYVVDQNLYEQLDDERKVYQLPRVLEEKVSDCNPLLAGELGSIFYNHAWYSDFSLNVTNSYSVAFFHNLGVKRVTLSYELSETQIADIIKSYQTRYQKQPNVEVIISSYPEVMVSKWDLKHEYPFSITKMHDKNHHSFFFRNRYGKTQIYYAKKLEFDASSYFQFGVSTVRISMIEPESNCKNRKH